MNASDRKELEWFRDRLRTSSIAGTDNVVELLKERDQLERFVLRLAEAGDTAARALILQVSQPLPHRW